MKADCHIHMVLDGVEWKSSIHRHTKAPDRNIIRKALTQYQKQGFTYLRDGGDRWGVGAAARELAPEYGICYRTPLSPLCMEGCYGSFIGRTYRNMQEYALLVQEIRRSGGDFIKIMVSGLMDFNQYGVLTSRALPPEMITQLIHIAHEEGMAVMLHANGAKTVEAAAAAGGDSIEHGAYLDADALDAMRQMGTVWVPTLSTIGNLKGTGRFQESAVERILESAMENISRFASVGGLLAPGTDAGAWAVPHGTDSEYHWMEKVLGEDTATILQRGTCRIRELF